ncbi:MAG: 50S ribosomal protein L17 [Candidatus Dependentiae bacterium ADurb.Bin331]|nr:MAG: 50S ribosomal protein L17 [Candidatus Dependentiae bacterium ADurb.Bin331]
MKHQIGRKKLNMKPSHKRSVLRNQIISLINNGHLVTTKVRVQEVRKLTEKLITIAREGNTFNVRRRVKALLPYSDVALDKLFTEIAPKYVSRPGGYTRVISLGQRPSDTATIARLEWV